MKQLKKFLQESVVNEANPNQIKLPLQIFPDGSKSDEYITIDIHTLQVVKVSYSAEYDLDYKVGDYVTFKWLSEWADEDIKSTQDLIKYRRQIGESRTKKKRSRTIKERATKEHFRNFIETFGDEFPTWYHAGSDREIDTESLMNTTILSYEIDSEAIELSLDNGETYYAPIDEDLDRDDFKALRKQVRAFFA